MIYLWLAIKSMPLSVKLIHCTINLNKVYYHLFTLFQINQIGESRGFLLDRGIQNVAHLIISKGPSIKDIRFFWPILDLLTYLYPIFGPFFGPIYLFISAYIRFLQPSLLTGTWDILYRWPLGLSKD